MSGSSDRTRVRSLDGLRGLAALIVMLSHVLLASRGSLSGAAQFGLDGQGLDHWLLRTPLAIWWAGPEMVMVFFVLSGFVLTRGFVTSRPRWGSFYLRRAVRLYLPVWASLIPAAILLGAVAAAPVDGSDSLWAIGAKSEVSVQGMIADAGLLLGGEVSDTTLNGVLWSLRYEVLFSAVLPVLLLARGALRRLTVLTALLALTVTAWGSPGLVYGAPFLLGVLLALHEHRLTQWRERVHPRTVAPAALLAIVLLTADRWLSAPGVGGRADVLVLAGAAAAVLVPLLYDAAARPLRHPIAQWLGSRSFSLYLIHLPLVVALSNGLSVPRFGVLAVVAVPASLIAAEIFHRAAERPAHRLARRLADGARPAPVLNAEPLPA